jgi:hypothetical protein
VNPRWNTAPKATVPPKVNRYFKVNFWSSIAVVCPYTPYMGRVVTTAG